MTDTRRRPGPGPLSSLEGSRSSPRAPFPTGNARRVAVTINLKIHVRLSRPFRRGRCNQKTPERRGRRRGRERPDRERRGGFFFFRQVFFSRFSGKNARFFRDDRRDGRDGRALTHENAPTLLTLSSLSIATLSRRNVPSLPSGTNRSETREGE